MISEIIEKWIKGILIDGITGNLSGLFDNVNAKVGEIASDVGSTPQAWNSGIFNMLRSLSETVVQGCRSYAYTYAITVAQTDAKSVILKKTDAANLVVGSAIDVGDGSDRQKASSYAVASSAVILSIEAYDDNNSRVNLDLAAGITTTTSNKINTIAWRSGSCDNVLGVDGSPTNCTSGKEPFIIQGIECMVGAYEVYADAIFKLESADGVFKITPWICKKASEITNNAIGWPIQVNVIWKTA